MISKTTSILLIGLLLYSLTIIVASAEQITVGAGNNTDFFKIQDAIDAASEGDMILVESGTYKEHLVLDKLVTLKGEGYPIVDGDGTGTVIWVRADKVHIEGLKVIRCDPARENTEDGIRLSANGGVVDNCLISDNNIGLGTGGKDNVISNCKFDNNRIGLVICGGEQNTVKNSHFTKGGVILDDARNNLIKDNIIELDPTPGVCIYNKADNNIFVGNTIRSNSMVAFEIVGSEWGPTSNGNKIYHNNIIDNGWDYQVYDDGNNHWDNGAEGNYWGDYEGKDGDGDGIGDMPYDKIGDGKTGAKTGAKDNYPLIEQWSGDGDTIPPTITITSPEISTTTQSPTITIIGTASDASGITSVKVNGTLASGAADWSTWSAKVVLAEGENAITMIATDGARLTMTKIVTVTYTPSAANAEITDLYLEGDGFFKRSDTVTAAVAIKNIDDVGHTFYVGFSMYDPDGDYVEGDYDAAFSSKYLEPGASSILPFTWEISSTAKSGHWDVTVAVWDREESGKLYGEYDRVTEEDAFFVDYKEKYALIVGVEEYKNSYAGCIENIDYSVDDAMRMKDILINIYGYAPDKVRTLYNDEATKDNIVHDITDITEIADSNDCFVFYFSGHGGMTTSGNEYICPYDSYPEQGNCSVRKNLYDVNLKELFDAFDRTTIIAIFDSCRSGGLCEKTDDLLPAQGIDSDRTVVLMACKASQEAKYNPIIDYGHRPFTNYLINGMRKYDSVEAAFAYAQNKVNKMFRQHLNYDQNPQMLDHYSGACYFSAIKQEVNSVTGITDCPVHLHATDSAGRHTGPIDDGFEEDIPGSYYNGPDYDPQEIIVLGQSDDIMYRIEALNEGVFNFTLIQSTETETTTTTYLDVPIIETTKATVEVSKENAAYAMEIDDDGDGISDYTKEPDAIEMVEAAPSHTPEEKDVSGFGAIFAITGLSVVAYLLKKRQ